MRPNKICFVTGSRAEYGHLLAVMKEVKASPEFEIQIVVTGAHLSKAHGETYREIENDGFIINGKVPCFNEDRNDGQAIAEATGKATMGFSKEFSLLSPDWIVILGDRYEMLAAAQAALMQKIRIAHIAGGDTTEGAFDEAIRHSISKMAHLHFATNSDAVFRLKQLGEDPKSIYLTGSPGLDLLHQLDFLDRKTLEKQTGYQFQTKNVLVTFHPVTLDSTDSIAQLENLIHALDSFGDSLGVLLTFSNADPSGTKMNEIIQDAVRARKHWEAVESLGSLRYLSLVRQVDVVIGNSSSGLYEVPSLGKPTVNIGDRQKGRMAAKSVIHCGPEKSEIIIAIKKAFNYSEREIENPYGDGRSAQAIVNVLKSEVRAPAPIKKHFWDYLNPSKSEQSRTYVIAEAGVNHNGSLDMAFQLIDAAAEAGADAVKFQTFKASRVMTALAPKADYQLQQTEKSESQLEMIQKLELNEDAHWRLLERCRAKNIEFLSTPFDLPSIDLLTDKMKIKKIKIPSGEITNAPFLLKVAQKQLPIILSTGMSKMSEVRNALAILAFGFLNPAGSSPSFDKCLKTFYTQDAQAVLRKKVSLLHCVTEYPAPVFEVNLKAMDAMRGLFSLRVGYSDHTIGIHIPVAAVARGASIIEKHFTLDRSLEGPDQKASLEPKELKKMISDIRDIELCLGNGEKICGSTEFKNKVVARKSLVAARSIKAGESFTDENMTVKRPESGVSAIYYWDYLLKKADKDYEADELIR